MKHRLEFYECEHEGDEQGYVDNLTKHPKIKQVTVVERPYNREYGEEVVIIEVESELTNNEIHDIGWGVEEEEPPYAHQSPGIVREDMAEANGRKRMRLKMDQDGEYGGSTIGLTSVEIQSRWWIPEKVWRGLVETVVQGYLQKEPDLASDPLFIDAVLNNFNFRELDNELGWRKPLSDWVDNAIEETKRDAGHLNAEGE